MRVCPNGHENPGDQHFCGECGAAIAPVAPVPGMSGAAWGIDPTGHHEYRYWDGSVWTEHVADQGTTSSDPVPETGAAQHPAPAAAVVAAPSVPASSAAASVGSAVAADPGTTGVVPAPENASKGPSKLVIGVLAALVVVLVGVGIFGFTRPASDDAKQKGDQVASQLAAIKSATATAKKGTTTFAGMRGELSDAISKLAAEDRVEATRVNNIISIFKAAVAKWNAGDNSAYSDPAIQRALDSLKSLLDEEKTSLTKLQELITQAKEAS